MSDDDIKVEVTAEHWQGFDPDRIECDHNPAATATLEALRASDRYRDRFPEHTGVDVLATDDQAWKVVVHTRLGPPWDWYATLLTWRVDDPGAVAGIDAVMYGDEAGEPFSFVLPTG